MIAVAAAMALPALSAAVQSEDLFALAVLEGRFDGLGPADVYREADAVGRMGPVQGDHFPWWASEPPCPRRLRPASAALLAFDHALWGLDPLGFRLTGLALFAALLLVALGGFDALAERDGLGRLALLAALLFALDDVHSAALASATERHASLGALLALGAWRAHDRGRTWLGLALLGLALAASETAAPVAGWLVAGALASGRGARRQALGRALPALGLALAFGAARAAGGYGDLGAILAGADAPGPARTLFVRLPITLAAIVAPIEPERLLEAPGGEELAVGCALLIVTFAALARPVLRAHASARFAAIAVGVHLPFAVLGEPSRADLVLPSFAGAWLIALVIRHHAWGGRGRRLLAAALLGVSSVLAPALHLRAIGLRRERAALQDRVAATIPREADARVLLLTSPEGVDVTLPLRAWLDADHPAGVWLLSLSRESHGLWHPSADTIGLSGELLVRQRERRWLGFSELAEGDRFSRGALEVAVAETDRDYGTRVDITLDVSPPEVILLARDGAGYRRVALPELGGAITLPAASR